jgi:alginate O-acetyltransferase complex protein AlgI
MYLNSLIFLFLFLPVTLLVASLLPTRMKNLFLLIASFVFFSWGGVSYLSVLVGSTLMNFLVGLALGRSVKHGSRKGWLVTGILLNLIPLAVFKYTGFVTDNINVLLTVFGWNPMVVQKIIMPLGISFYSFKAVTYLVSVYRSETPVQRNYTRLALYLSFFPSLLAGPIDRYRDFLPQLSNHNVTFDRFASGIRRFALGLAKKILIANTLAVITDELFNTPLSTLSTPLAWLGVICYALQIYYDFSGYTDMAIGLGHMLGFKLTENFNSPYISKSIKEFWQRWHITLSTWLRDYVFLPLAYSSSRKLKQERYLHLKTDHLIYMIAITATFLVCGIWHGAAWNFVVWGLFHGLLLILEQMGLLRILKRFPKPIRHMYTIFFLLITWVFFRTTSLSDAFQYIGILFGNGITSDWGAVTEYFSPGFLIAFLIALLGSTPVFKHFISRMKGLVESENKSLRILSVNFYESASLIIVILMITVSVICIVAGTNNPFIYFKF